MSKRACIIVAHGVEEIELGIIVNILNKAAVDVTVASAQKSQLVECSRSVQIQADTSLEEVKNVSEFCPRILVKLIPLLERV